MKYLTDRIAYKFARAYGYRHMLKRPETEADELASILADYLKGMESWSGLPHVAETQAKEAVGHVLFIVDQGRLHEAINSPQGQFPSVES